MHRALIVLFVCLWPAMVVAQPVTPCPPNEAAWTITTTGVTMWVCASNGLSWLQLTLPKANVGLGNADNTSDANKPISSATQTALNAKGTSNFSGAYTDLTGKPTLGTAAATASTDYATAAQGATANSALQPAGNGGSLTGLTKSQVGLSNVDNTSDANKPISSATQTALNGKQATLVSATNIKTVNGSTLLGSGDLVVGGGSGPSYVVTTQDTTNATTSYANIVGLVFNVAANTRYRISCPIPYDANATTTGIGVGWVGPASPTLTRALMTAGLTTATVGGTTIAGNDTGAVTTASVATTNNLALFEGIWSNGANAGTIQMRVKSEVAVANAIIVRTGAMCAYAVY